MYQLRMLVWTIILICFFNPTEGAVARASGTAENSSQSEYISKEIRRMMRKYHLPALAITIVDEKDVIFQEALGLIDVENGIEASTASVFKLWSVAKVFTALEIFREVEDGLIQLDAPISAYLPEFTIRSRFPEAGPITVKSLLAHRSGLPRNECLPCNEIDKNPHILDPFERSASACYLAFPPESRYKYSNLGYDLLGRIVEQNRNEGFTAFMSSHLLDDLGMHHTSFNSMDVQNGNQLAIGYEYYKRSLYPMIQSDINSVPSGNLYSTIEDLSIFLKAALNNELFKSKHTMQQMFTDHYSREEDPETMGLGWKTTRIGDEDLMVWHDGGPGEGIGSIIALLPDQKLGIAIVANSTSFSSNRTIPLVQDILNHLLDARLDRLPPPTKNPDRIVYKHQLLSDFEGRYIAFGMVMDVKAKKRKLIGKIGGLNLNFIPVSDTEFRVTHWMDKIGLTKIIKPPVDFDKIGISFLESGSDKAEQMILNLDNISFEICPRYPVLDTLPDKWKSLPGAYQLAWRDYGNRPGHFSGDEFLFSWEDQVLNMSGVFGPLLPKEENFIRILSGPFAGETMEYFPETGHLVHQNAVFVPRN